MKMKTKARTNRNVRKNTRRKPEKKWFSFKAVLKGVKVFSVLLAVASMLSVSGYYGSRAVQQFLAKPIASVMVNSEFSYLAKNEVIALINNNIQKSFVSENLSNMRGKLEKNPWVDSVVLRRQWPDTLHVEIIEEKPIARWGSTGFVNHRGELIKVDNGKLIEHLPLLQGEDNQAIKLMKQYQLLSQMLNRYGMRIIGLKQDSLGLWTIYLDNDWKLIAGRNDVAKKMQRLMTMLDMQKIQKPQDIEAIDLRYNNGLAVRWKKHAEHAKRDATAKEQNI